MERRRTPRLLPTREIIVTVAVASTQQVLDVSVGGALLGGADPITDASTGVLQMAVAGTPIDPSVVVRHRRFDKIAGRHLTGVEFADLETPVRELLESWLGERRTGSGRPAAGSSPRRDRRAGVGSGNGRKS